MMFNKHMSDIIDDKLDSEALLVKKNYAYLP